MDESGKGESDSNKWRVIGKRQTNDARFLESLDLL